MKENEVESIMSTMSLNDTSRRIVILRNEIDGALLVPVANVRSTRSLEPGTLIMEYFADSYLEKSVAFRMVMNVQLFVSAVGEFEGAAKDRLFHIMEMFAGVKNYTLRTARKFLIQIRVFTG